jgi:xanthine dehydrogenase molybdopterin-binding subunit B
MAVTMTSIILQDVTSCGLVEVHRGFGGTYSLQLQNRIKSQASNRGKASSKLRPVNFYQSARRHITENSALHRYNVLFDNVEHLIM